MKKRIKAFSMALLMILITVLTAVNDIVIARADDLTIKLHYHREDGNYDGWDVWMWEVGGADGAAHELAEEDGEMVATKVVTPGITSVGFIVRTADWTKDIDEDQFIDLAEMVSGTVDIYVESGVKGYTKEYRDDAVTGTKVSAAKYDGESNVIVTMTGAIEGDIKTAFTVKGSDGEVAVADVTAGENNEYTVKLSEALVDTKSYTITFDGNEYKVVMPSIYSTDKFESEYTYTGNDLGATWTKDKTTFRVWAPTAETVKVNLYKSGTEGTDDLIEQLEMKADVNGTWVAEKTGDLNGTYYTYLVNVNGAENEACDPYARTTGVNGKRAMVIDLASTNPTGWDTDKDPHAGLSYTDAIIYELHVRDLSSDSSSGISNVGKFLGLTETGTKTASGVPTGIDHIRNLGITHIHLLPSYDFGSVDETKLDTPQFNWGYDPVNYNVPEGSYSTDPYNGEVRVKEMKQMVQSLHNNNISVVMDVVYNHVYNSGEFCFNKIVPAYFSRVDENGKYSNGSGCGNDTASERAMVKKYIVDSVKYWADEYHIDGFRFDLVGLIDTVTINEIVTEVHKDHPNVIFYGEGWSMSTTLTKEGYEMATQVNSPKTPGFAYFSDTIRDLLKGSVFSETEPGYITGATGLEDKLKKCFMGLSPIWCKTPSQTVNYASCHDNNTLYDRITMTLPDASEADRIKMNNLAASIYLMSEGIPFIHAGEEMLRTKVKEDGTFDHNSYSSPDSVNSFKWNDLDKAEYMNVYNYYKGLISFRKNHAALRIDNPEDVNSSITAVDGLDANVVAFNIKGGVNEEVADGIFVIFNPNNAETEVALPDGEWKVCVNAEKAGTDVIETVTDGKAKVAPISAMVLVQGETTDPDAYQYEKPSTSTGDGQQATTATPGTTSNNKKKDNGSTTLLIIAAIAVVGLVAYVVVSKKKKPE